MCICLCVVLIEWYGLIWYDVLFLVVDEWGFVDCWKGVLVIIVFWVNLVVDFNGFWCELIVQCQVIGINDGVGILCFVVEVECVLVFLGFEIISWFGDVGCYVQVFYFVWYLGDLRIEFVGGLFEGLMDVLVWVGVVELGELELCGVVLFNYVFGLVDFYEIEWNVFGFGLLQG